MIATRQHEAAKSLKADILKDIRAELLMHPSRCADFRNSSTTVFTSRKSPRKVILGFLHFSSQRERTMRSHQNKASIWNI